LVYVSNLFSFDTEIIQNVTLAVNWLY